MELSHEVIHACGDILFSKVGKPGIEDYASDPFFLGEAVLIALVRGGSIPNLIYSTAWSEQ